jgi:hypothetical protein
MAPLFNVHLLMACFLRGVLLQGGLPPETFRWTVFSRFPGYYYG